MELMHNILFGGISFVTRQGFGVILAYGSVEGLYPRLGGVVL